MAALFAVPARAETRLESERDVARAALAFYRSVLDNARELPSAGYPSLLDWNGELHVERVSDGIRVPTLGAGGRAEVSPALRTARWRFVRRNPELVLQTHRLSQLVEISRLMQTRSALFGVDQDFADDFLRRSIEGRGRTASPEDLSAALRIYAERRLERSPSTAEGEIRALVDTLGPSAAAERVKFLWKLFEKLTEADRDVREDRNLPAHARLLRELVFHEQTRTRDLVDIVAETETWLGKKTRTNDEVAAYLVHRSGRLSPEMNRAYLRAIMNIMHRRESDFVYSILRADLPAYAYHEIGARPPQERETEGVPSGGGVHVSRAYLDLDSNTNLLRGLRRAIIEEMVEDLGTGAGRLFPRDLRVVTRVELLAQIASHLHLQIGRNDRQPEFQGEEYFDLQLRAEQFVYNLTEADDHLRTEARRSDMRGRNELEVWGRFKRRLEILGDISQTRLEIMHCVNALETYGVTDAATRQRLLLRQLPRPNSD